MGLRFAVAAVFALISYSLACHHGLNSDDEGDKVVQRITKRHTPIQMEDFLADCIMRKTARFRSRLYVPTIVDFMIRHSSWFEETDTIYCPSDDNACWKRLVNYFMKWNSPYLGPAKSCIDEFTIAGGGRVTPSYQIYQPRFWGQSPATGDVNINEFKHLFRSYAPKIDSSDESTLDLHSLVNYFRTEYICTPSFCDCSGLTLSQGQTCGSSWISRLAGATKSSSVFKSAVTTAANVAIQRQQQRNQQRRAEEQARQRRQRMSSLQNLLTFYVVSVLSNPSTPTPEDVMTTSPTNTPPTSPTNTPPTSPPITITTPPPTPLTQPGM